MIHRAVLLTFLICAAARTGHGAGAAGTWAERLGYPADKRVVILYANHMGAAYEFNRRGQALLQEGLVQSAGVMPPCPWFDEFARWCRDNPGHDVGVCLSLNSPSESYRWGPLVPRDRVPSLVDADGYLWRNLVQVAVRADAKDVRREIDAQIERARAAGIRPTHLVPLMGALLTRADLTDVYLEAAEKYWLPAVMIELTPAQVDKLRQDGIPLDEEVVRRVARYPLPKLDDIQFVPDADSYDNKREMLFDLVRNLEPGLTMIVFQPAEESHGLKLITSRWQNCVWEADLLADRRVREFLESEGLLLTNWKEIMQRFEQEPGGADE